MKINKLHTSFVCEILRILRRWRWIILPAIFLKLFLQVINPVFKQLFDFREQTVFDAIKIQALQLDHAIAMATGKFLNPVAHGLLAVLNLVMQGTLDESSLDFHIALHIERHAVSTNKLLQQHQQAKIVVFVIVNELP